MNGMNDGGTPATGCRCVPQLMRSNAVQAAFSRLTTLCEQNINSKQNRLQALNKVILSMHKTKNLQAQFLVNMHRIVSPAQPACGLALS